MHLRNTHGIVREDLEERENEGRGRHRAGQQCAQPTLFDQLAGQIEGIGACTARRDIAQDDLGALDDSRFDVHGVPRFSLEQTFS